MLSVALLGTQHEPTGLSSKRFSYVLHVEVAVVRTSPQSLKYFIIEHIHLHPTLNSYHTLTASLNLLISIVARFFSFSSLIVSIFDLRSAFSFSALSASISVRADDWADNFSFSIFALARSFSLSSFRRSISPRALAAAASCGNRGLEFKRVCC